MRRRFSCLLLSLAGLGLAVLPSIGWAQGTVGHSTVYTRSTMEELLQDQGSARTNMPMVSPGMLSRSMLLHHNTLPTGPVAPVAGAAPGSSDGTPRAIPQSATPDAYGSGGQSGQPIAPFTTARASAAKLGWTPIADAVGTTSYPWRATGKLYFKISGAEYVCSASMVKPGLLLTAGHCVYEFGTNTSGGWHTDYVFVPAQFAAGAAEPYGHWTAVQEHVLTPWFDGTDTCLNPVSNPGVTCNNDIATLTMNYNANKKLPGEVVGWYGYGWNGYSYVNGSFGGASLASITQLGYPVAFDGGLVQERTDGIGSFWLDGNLKNTLLGSAMTGGSSGGPWMVNFGAVPNLSSEASLGSRSNPDVVVGVTSWGFTTVGVDAQGASWFGENVQYPAASYSDSHGVDRGAGNIGKLIADSCSAAFKHC